MSEDKTYCAIPKKTLGLIPAFLSTSDTFSKAHVCDKEKYEHGSVTTTCGMFRGFTYKEESVESLCGTKTASTDATKTSSTDATKTSSGITEARVNEILDTYKTSTLDGAYALKGSSGVSAARVNEMLDTYKTSTLNDAYAPKGSSGVTEAKVTQMLDSRLSSLDDKYAPKVFTYTSCKKNGLGDGRLLPGTRVPTVEACMARAKEQGKSYFALEHGINHSIGPQCTPMTEEQFATVSASADVDPSTLPDGSCKVGHNYIVGVYKL